MGAQPVKAESLVTTNRWAGEMVGGLADVYWGFGLRGW